MKKFNHLIVSLLLICSSAYSVDKVYPLGEETYGIVADDVDWICEYVSIPNRSDTDVWIGSGPYIRGTAKNLPIKFMFFKSCLGWNDSMFSSDAAVVQVQQMLSTASEETTTLFSNLELAHEDNNSCLFYGTCSDLEAIGYFAILIQKDVLMYGSSFVMVINIQERSLDEQTKESLCQKAFALITPLVN